MKKKTIAILVLLLALIGLIISSPKLTRNRTSMAAITIDLLNPLVPDDVLYVKTTDSYEKSYKDAANGKDDYAYITTGYDEEGKDRRILYTSFGRPLTPDRYLKLKTKGQCVRSFEEVQLEDIPDKAQQRLP